mmetsp:Transcript_9813/g.29910  ORF Transcript_9813/g.29910 Transcript_9813/m.29910 type:complete len:201 (-) Transcript_9813:150-752(-)
MRTLYAGKGDPQPERVCCNLEFGGRQLLLTVSRVVQRKSKTWGTATFPELLEFIFSRSVAASRLAIRRKQPVLALRSHGKRVSVGPHLLGGLVHAWRKKMPTVNRSRPFSDTGIGVSFTGALTFLSITGVQPEQVKLWPRLLHSQTFLSHRNRVGFSSTRCRRFCKVGRALAAQGTARADRSLRFAAKDRLSKIGTCCSA